MDRDFIWILSTVSNLVRFVTTLTRPVSEWILELVHLVIMGRTGTLPPITNRILLMAATELAQNIRTRQLSVQEILAEYIQRCKDIHPKLNAQTASRFGKTLKEAKHLDSLISRSNMSIELLEQCYPAIGLPFSCTETLGIEGMSQTNGLQRLRKHRARRSAEASQSFCGRRVIPFIVTNVPEVDISWTTANHVHGWTRNPYDSRRIVGGTSGGESALIAAAGSICGIGSDIAGGLRLAVSFCGIYGHKPSTGLISNRVYFPDEVSEEIIACDAFRSIGPICRYSSDLKLFTRLMSHNNRVVSWSTQVDFTNVNIFFMEEFPGRLLSATSDIKAAVRKAVQYFEIKYGVTAVKLDLPEMKYAFEMWECKRLEAGCPCLLSELDPNQRMDIAWEFFLKVMNASDYSLSALYFAATERRNKDSFYEKCLQMYVELERKLEEYLKGDVILLIPTHPNPPPHYLMTIPKFPNIAYTCIFNILGYPSTQTPAGMSRGLPIRIKAKHPEQGQSDLGGCRRAGHTVFKGWLNPSSVSL